MIKNEWQNLLHNKILLIVLIAIVAIPTIYTTLFLGSMWDPYGQLEQLPVAVVNEDKEVVYYNEKLDVGSRLVLNLKENDSLKFDFVNSSTARKRLEDGKYYMVITIPENFSKNASTLLDDKPQKMVLLYDTNPGRNYIAAKMSESALSKIKDSVATEVTKTYAQVMFEQIGTVGAGMNEAAAGSGTLKSGLEQLSDGNTKISANLQLLSDSTLTFKGGSDELKQGLEKYIQGVEQANKGAKQLNAGVSQLKAGTDEVQAKLPELSKDAGQLAEGTKGLSDGTSRLMDGGRELKDGAVHVDDNMRTLNAGLSQLRDQTSMLPESAEQLDTGAQSLKTGAAKLQTGMNGLNQGMKSLQNGALELNGGLTQLAGPGAEQLYNGLDKVKAELSNQLISTADSISAGDAGEDVGYLSDMLDTAVASGDTAQIAEIAKKAIGLAESNQDAARTANSNVQTLPVEAKETQITDVRNNGHAMAAYMMSVGLWVACIAFCIMYPLTEYSGELKSGFRWWLSKAAVIYPIAVFMASAMVGMLYLINGFRPVEWGKTILVACIASMTFMSIMYFFNVLFGKVGSFIMLIFMVVQLAGSAGTYPIELSGSFVAKIHKWLPFSYTVDAFRATIAGGSKIGNAVFALAVLTAVFTAMTVWIFQIRASRLKRGKQSLYDYIEKAGLA